MTPRHRAEARHRAYALIARLFTHGLDAQSRPLVAALPALEAAVDGDDPDRWAAQHHDALSRQVLPWQSVFVGDGQLGGEVSAAVLEHLQRAGVATDDVPDHIGTEAALLAHLSAAERDALVDGDAHALGHVRDLQRAFLSEHLLRWLPALVVALRRADTGLYAAVGELLADVVADHARELGAKVLPEPASEGFDTLLDEPRTRLKHVVRALLQTRRSGLFLSQRSMGRVAAQAGVPEGFGTREKKLEGIVFAAIDHERTVELLDAMLQEVATYRNELVELQARGLSVQGWIERLEASRAAVERIREGVARPVHPPEASAHIEGWPS